jgi:crossover junction endodeoxyribonuclease RuvC
LRVLGIDPGTVITGWGVVEVHRGSMRHLASGTIRAGRGEVASRLGFIYAELGAVLVEHVPDAVSLERNFLARNVQSAFRLGEARGVAMAAAAARGVSLSEYTPATIKKCIAGHGGADKAQIQKAVARLLGISQRLAADEADALAAAACHVLRSGFDARVRAASARQEPAVRLGAVIRARVLG